MAEDLANTTAMVSQDLALQQFCATMERSNLDLMSNNDESYNCPFSMWELESVLSVSHDTATGQDCIQNFMLRHLSGESKENLFECFNLI